jgi:osmotically-inducible protein OsmY
MGAAPTQTTIEELNQMRDDRLERDISDELRWDPKVDEAGIAVTVYEGDVTLRGTVGSLGEKLEAKKAAERVRGVTGVHNDLEVRIMDDVHRADADLRGDVLRALLLDSVLPTSIDAKAKDGKVTLTGIADWQFEREEAEHVAAGVRGVVAVQDDIELTKPADYTGDVEDGIKLAFERSAQVDADHIIVQRSGGTVTLVGTARTGSERDEAIAAAWASPGVLQVENEIVVEP